jgi:LPXTG-motif cell wall-anchored protein
MRRTIIALALTGVLLSGWAIPAGAQENGVIIQNNGVDSYDTAAGANNVRISQNPGNSQAIEGVGLNNEVAVGERAPRDRDRKNRDNAGEEMAAPMEEAPVDAGYDAYADPNAVPAEGYADAAPQEEVAQPAEQTAPIKLPNTGSGSGTSLPLAAIAAALLAIASGAAGARRRFIG